MAKRLLDVDPFSGLATYHDYDSIAQRNIITYEQDASAAVDMAERLGNDSDYTRRGMKSEMVHYAHIPDIVLLKMRFFTSTNFAVVCSQKQILLVLVEGVSMMTSPPAPTPIG